MNQTSFNQLTKISKTFKKLKKTSFDELKFYLITIYHKTNSKLIKKKRFDFVMGSKGLRFAIFVNRIEVDSITILKILFKNFRLEIPIVTDLMIRSD